jgi:hypothetical protein
MRAVPNPRDQFNTCARNVFVWTGIILSIPLYYTCFTNGFVSVPDMALM